MSIGTFILVKNEAPWIGAHLENIFPHVSEAVFYVGNSQDGMPEIISLYPAKLVRNKDPKDLKDDYVRLFNECLHQLSTDFAIFLHPDMWVENPERMQGFMSDATALSCRVISYAGEPGGQLYRIDGDGRSSAWKNVYRLKPDLGHHYFGHYGAQNEDVYFSEITGDEHIHYGPNFRAYPYEVKDSGLIIHHFSDVRPYERRLDRMVKSMKAQGWPDPEKSAREHPRVTLKSCGGFIFTPVEWPEGWLDCKARAENKMGVLDA